MLELIAGKAGIDQLAQRFGVLPETIEAWRDEAIAGIAETFRRGTAKSPREAELERENADLREALIESTMKVTLLQRAAGIHGARPTRPARSRR